MSKVIRNKVAEAGLVTIDLLDYAPKETIKEIDLKSWLVDELIIKELDFKKKLGELDVSNFKNSCVYIHCSKDVIIPTWAFLLLQTKLTPFTKYIFFGSKKDLILILFKRSINNLDFSFYKNKRVFIKGCGDASLPVGAFSIITHRLSPVVKSLFYGEVCSNVPLIKNI